MSLYESFLLLNMFRMLLYSSSDTTLLQPNRTNTPVPTETEQYTHIQSPAPEDEYNSIRNMLSNKNVHKEISSWFNLFNWKFFVVHCFQISEKKTWLFGRPSGFAPSSFWQKQRVGLEDELGAFV